MEDFFKVVTVYISFGIELCAGIFIAVGAIQAIMSIIKIFWTTRSMQDLKNKVWLNFAIWLVLALEFELAADILRTAISPTWTDIGQLAVIAVVRTFLNYFLEMDIDKLAEKEGAPQTT